MYCNGHKNPWAASLLERSEEMESQARRVIKDVNVHVNVMCNKYEWCSMYVCAVRNNLCVCWGTLGGKRRWVKCEQQSLRIQTTSSGWRGFGCGPQMGTEPESVDGQKGTHAGHIREVPQEEHSPSMYIVQSRHMLIIKRNFNLRTTYCKYC